MHNSLVVAALQLECQPNQRDENLQHAELAVRSAVAQGAQLALMPELTPNGYRMTEELWLTAEPFDGPSTSWLRTLARSTNAYLGMTFLEADGSDIFDTFAMAGPDGRLFPRVRKSPPAGPEAFFFTSGSDPHWFDTEFGRVGVGICYENFLAERLLEFHRSKVDLVLQPFSAPTPMRRFPLRALDVRISDAAMRDQPPQTAKALGVPVVMANRSGPFASPMPGRLPSWNTSFPGLSAVVDGDGTVKCQLGATEGTAIAMIALDPSRRVASAPRTFGRWAMPAPWWYSLLPLVGRRGARAYLASESRRATARAIACDA